MDTSDLATQVSTIIGQLHGLFDEIGVPSNERKSRETELFTALSEALHSQLRIVAKEKNELVEEARRIIKTIRQMESSLQDEKPKRDFSFEDDELKVTTPLTRCLETLKEKYNTVARLHRDRLEEVKKLVEALDSYACHLEPTFVQIALPPMNANASVPPTFDLSPSYLVKLESEFTRVYEEFSRRLDNVKSLAEETVGLWAELGTPQAQTDASIIKHCRETPEQLGLHANDIARLSAKRDKLIEEKRQREKKLKDLKSNVESLWDRLGVEELDRKRFLAGTRGCGLRVINDFEAELDRLNELKRQNLHLFIEDARFKLQEYWDSLYFSEEEMLDFTPAFSDVYSDALLSAHEAEIARLETLKEQRLPTLQLIDKHRSLIKDREDLAASSQDASRLMLKPQKGEKRDPTRLLREEKMRKRIAKDLPKIEAELIKVLEGWEDDYGRPFLVHGNRYLDEIEAANAASKPVPPRSKTPSALVPASRAAKEAPRAAPVHSRPNSVMRAPVRPPAKTPVSTLRRNPLASSVSSIASTIPKPISPSKIPARVPLSNMRTGNNSPERKGPPPSTSGFYDSTTIRKMGPPPRAPPPKMRDLFVPPNSTPSQASDEENWQSASVASSYNGLVRSTTPEDVYNDRQQRAYRTQPHQDQDMHSTPVAPHQPQRTAVYEQHYQTQQYFPHADSRQISSTSTTSQPISGSENWETFDDASEPEPDARDAYYAKLNSARGKRMTPDGGPSPRQTHAKKLRNVYENTHGAPQTYIEDNGRMVPAGSDAGWTDEDAF